MGNLRYLVTSHICKHRTNDFKEAVAVAERCVGHVNIIDSVTHQVIWPEKFRSSFDSSFKASVNRRVDKEK